MRLRSDIWVAAYLRRCVVEGCNAVLRRRGASEAGAIFVVVDRLDGSAALFGPAPQAALGDAERLWQRLHDQDFVEPAVIEARLQREIRFDPDLWIVDVEDKAGRSFLDLVA